MISACVFSKNRAMQLDAFLKSLENAPYITQTRVLYTTTDDEFDYAYDKLKKEHSNIEFIKEDNLHEQVLEVVRTSHEHFLWATDDSIFYKKAELDEEKMNWAFKTKGALAFNLRMGLNIKWQNHWYGERSQPIEVADRFKDVIIWDAEKYSVNTDVGRVWQNDASIMPRDMYYERLLVEPGWRNGRGVRELDNTGGCGRMFSPCFVAAFEESVYLNIPVNLVHLLNDGRLYADNWGKFHQQSVGELNELFLKGRRINWKTIDTRNLDCGRREVQYDFI